MTGCINITKPFTIYGNGWSIDAKGYCRIFNITSADVTLNRVTLVGGDAGGIHGFDGVDKGGAIYWSGANGNLINSTIANCSAAIGGGLYLNESASDCTIESSGFFDNIATGNGGAIDCNSPRMKLYNTTFGYNKGEYGAALCREAGAIQGSGANNIFIGNNATKGGAALGWIKAERITIINYTFIDNTAGISGGAIFVDNESTSCTIINSTFEGNYIYNETAGHGGAIEWYSKKGAVINSTFIRNYAYDGGAIYANNESEEINISNSYFENNYAYSYGGAISLEASKVTINHTTFKDNHAVNGGGAVFVNGTAASNNISYSVFESNWVSEGNGGGIDWLASAGNISYSNFTNNSAVYGGGIYLSGNSNNSVIDHVIFKGNNATKNGGAIDWNAQNGHLLNNQFISNEAEYGAALCREIGATGGSGRNNIFTLNHARISGPALAWMGSDNITIVNYNFTYNTAVVSGGAIYVSNISNNCSVIDCNFIGNRICEYNEDSYGGAIDWRGADGKIINSNFTKNHAFNGGAVFVGTDHGITNITDSAFIENSAHENGGAISLNASSVHLNRTIFRYNTALSGGAVYVGEKGDSNYIYYSTFDNNKAIKDEDHLIVSGQEAHGGAINWLSAAGHILYSNFTNNSADYGGGIYLNGKSNNTVMDHLIFKGNNATKNGGALDWNAQNGQLFNCSFISNYAGEFGAALCREAEATGGSGIDNSFEYNHAGIAGAALAWMGSVGITITNYTFNYNTANKYGAAIYVAQDSHNCSIIDSRFLGNEIINETGGMGGAVYTVAQNTTVHNTNFTLNKAHDGGAIYIGGTGGRTNITDSNFTRNSAVEEGGAIYLSSSNAVINRTLFSYNTAHDGGAIYAGGTGEVNEVYMSSFDNNRAEGGFGGAINWVAAAGHIYYTNFTNNYAKYGGGIHFNGNSNGSKVVHVIFENNTATENGGAMESNASEIELTYTVFTTNYAKYGAALCRESGATGGHGHNNTFDRNHAYISGAALAWMNVSNIRIINYTFINNTADVSGAAIYVSDGSDNCKVYNCYFEENYVTNAIRGRGGAIDWIGNKGEVKNTTFISCVAVEGGAIYVGENSHNMTIFNTSFESCKATGGNGGALELLGDDVTITLSNFTSCFSLKSGGAIAPIGSENLTVTSSRFISCVSFDFGGAIAGIYSNNANISDSYFKFNHAAGHTTPEHDIYGEGGAISWSNSRNLTVSNSTFVSNNAYLSGGSISADNCNDSYVYDIKTYNETAEFNGGSFSWSNSRNVTIENILCNDSGANYKGGSIYLGNVDNVTVKNAFLNSTWASWGQGGGIYVTGNSTLINITLRDGHALDHVGNGIYFASGNSSLINSTFTETINVIYIAEGPTGRNNTVYLINNTIRGENPNRNITHIDNKTIYNYDYSIWNEGVLYLDGNDFDYIIFNNGTIMTHTITYMLGGKTYNTTWNTNFTFYADIYDDTGNNNTIISVQSLDTFNNHPDYENETYFMPCNQLPLVTYLQGKFVLGARDQGLKDNTVVNGTLNNKMPTELAITHSDLTQELVNFTATITTPVDSNYTIQNQRVDFVIHDESGKLPDVICNGTILDGVVKWSIASANISQNHMHVGTYTVTATYHGDEFHHNATVSMLLLLESHPIELVIEAADIYYGQTIVCNITSNATSTENGRIRISINGKEVDTHIRLENNGTKIINITYEQYKDIITEPAEYTLSVEFENGTYYQRTTNFTAVEVKKLNATMGANATTPIVWGDPEIINVTIGKNETMGINVTGFVKLVIDGEDYIEDIKEGKVQFKIHGLRVGTYSDISIEYMGDDFYNENSTPVTFTVNPKDISDIFDVQVDNITYGQNATVRVLVPTDAGGNVTIYVDNRPGVTVNVTNGIARLEDISGLAGGEHVVNVTYNGDGKYKVDYLNGTKFKVNPDTTWKVNVTDVKYMPYGQTTIINVTNIPGDLLSDTITIRIDGVDYVRPIVDGKATLRLNNLSAGSHSGFVVYAGDDNYGPISQVFRPNIPKAEPTIRVTQNGTDLTATVTSDVGNVTGNVTFKVNNVEHTINLTNGNATLVGKLKIGDNYVIATYNGNANYTAAQIADVYNVAKLNTTVTVNSTNITFGEDEIINVTVNVNATGFIAVRIGTQIYVSYINHGIARLNITGLAAKVYDNVVVTYYPDTTDFNGNFNVTSFTVNRTKDYKFNVEVDAIEYGQNATVRVSLDSLANGNVTIYVDNRPGVTVNVTNGEAVLGNISGLAGGQHVVNVTYNGDSSFAVNYNNGTEFMVNPNTSWKVNVTDVKYMPYGQTTTINVTNIPSDLLGNTITIRIDGVDYVRPIVDGKATLRLNNLSAGSHDGFVVYAGDDNYGPISQIFRPNIPKATPTVSLDKDADGNVVATVNGNNATGIVTFILDGCEYPIELTSERTATLTKNHLTIGNNGVVAIYEGDKNYTNARNVKNFTVNKDDTNIVVNPIGDKKVDDDVVITVGNLPSAATGYVVVEVVGVANYTINLTAGKNSVTIKGLADGTYRVNATYLGDENYLASYDDSKSFTVSKWAAKDIDVQAGSVDYGNPAVIVVTVPSDDMTGTITLTLNDTAGTSIELPIYNKQVTWNVAGLAAGKYTVDATYNGNYKYNINDTLSKTFEVRKVAPSLTIDDSFTDALTPAEITVHINKTATGSITIIVEGKPYTQPITDGVATFTIDVLPAGDYDISAFYNPGEDKNYTGGFNTNIKGLHVTKVSDYTITVTGMNITVHDDEIITVTVPTGVTSVSIWVDGNKRTNSSFTGGVAKFNVTDLKLDAGVHYVNATVNDVAYASKVVNNTFIISPIDTTLHIAVHAVTIWDKEYINVTIKDADGNVITDASGKINITLNGVDNPVSIDSGVARFNTADLVVGENIVCAYYAGEINYVGNHSIATFTVTQRTPKANVTATNVTVDTPTTITVTIPANTTGFVIITGNFTDKQIYLGQDNFTNEGVATINVGDLAAGKYSVHIKYYGLDTDPYSTVENDTTFKVSKLSSKVTVEVDNITYGDNAAVNITVTIDAASGNVTITIGGEYNKTVGVTDGVISVIVPGLTAGDKTVNVTYNGNYKYLPSSNSTDFTVSGADVSMIVITQNVTYGENETITVYVNAEGNVTFRIDNNDYGTVNITGGKAVLNVPLEAGNHTVEAIYNGAPGFNSTSLKANFTVEKADPIMSIDVQNIIFGGVEHIRVHVNAEGDVTIRVIGTGIVETISLENGEKDIILRAGPSDSYEGNATLNIYNLRGGRYPVEVTYNGNGNYNKLTASTEFEVYKADTSMYIEAEPYIDAGEDQTINITLSSVKATGWVYVYLAGRVSPRPVFDGLANYTTPLLESGKYQYVIIYEGDENFNPYIAQGTFEVGDAPSLKDVSIGLDVEPYLHAGETQVINITMSDSEATGRVTIILDNNNYTRILDNGVANFTTPVLPGGNYTVVVIYEGNYMFNSNWTYDSFEVESLDPSRANVSISLEINPHVPAGETQVINITMSDSAATGKITISVDGEKYTENLTNGAANFTIPALSSGNHTVVVIYEGDENFNGNWTYSSFEVDKIPSSVSVDVTHNPTGEDQTITVTADRDDATGYAIVDVDGTSYAVELNNGTGSVTISGLTAGDHIINVTYLGDENYAPSSDETTLSLSKLPSGVEVNVENITVGDKAVIEITVPENATGNATVNVDGTDYTVSVAGGKGTLVLSDLGVGNHEVTVTYNGDEIYDSSSDSATFEVAKQDGNDVVKVTDQGNGTIVVEVPEGTTGTVTVEVDGENYTGEIVDGKAVIKLENATPGVHDMKVTVPGNENRTETVIDTTASIPKEATPLDVSVDGDTIVVTVPEGASGNITIEVDGKTYTQPINGNEAKFTIDDLTVGDKTAVVKYAGDDNYVANSTSVDFTVPEVDPDMNVTVEGGDVGEDVTVTVELPEDATGQVLIDIDGVGFYANVTDGVAKLVIPNVLGGSHDVKVTYTGDDKYASDSYSGSFDMNKVDSSVTVSAEDITVGDKAVIEITVPEDATDNVTVNVDGTDYTAYVANGKATLVLSDLGVGEHEVTVTYNGDGKYNSSTGSATFEVAKQDGDDVVKVTDQGDGTVVVEVPEGTTGTVTVEVDGENYTGEIVDGKAVINLENATPGVHDMKVTVPGNENRTETVINTSVTIPKEETTLDVTVKDIKVGDKEGIVVEVPEDATGNVTIEIDGKTYTLPVSGGKATFAIEGLTAGNKTAVIRYSGDDKYDSSITTATFNVAKVNATIGSTIDDSKVGENVVVNVVLPDDATGVVLIDIGGVGYYANVTDGVAHVEIPRIPSGYYNVTITYTGDEKYSSVTNTTSFNMSKVESFVVPNAINITYGENEIITLDVPEDATGNVTLVINGVEYTLSPNGELLSVSPNANTYTVAVSGGYGVITISGLPEGEYTVSARYNGDDKYFVATNSTKFRVSKSKLTMEVIDQGNGTVLVKLPSDATGNVTIKVGNETYSAIVENGVAWITLDNETPGIHEITVTYSGDDQYNSKTVESSVVIPKYDAPIDVDAKDINVGETLNVEITLPEGATGTVTVEIDGQEYSATVEGGKVIIPVLDLTAGDKTLVVKYSGDDNYLANVTTVQFTVSKLSSTISASAKDTSLGNDVVINVEVPKDATGRVLVNIGGVGYYGDIINGRAKVFIPDLPIGSYTATVTYEGDDRYLPSDSVTVSFSVTKADAPMSAYGTSIEVGEDGIITVTLPDDATGTVTLKIDGKTYVMEVKDGKAVFVIPGLAPGDYKIVAIYSGDDKYAGNVTESDLVVYNNETPGGNTPDYHSHSDGAVGGLSRYATGNPLLILLLSLIALGISQLRRFKR